MAHAGCKRNDEQTDAGVRGRSDESRPNIVMISIDTLRSDHLGSYGYDRDTSPRIDRLATEGALFENMISSTSWTLPAHCALFTGLSDSVHGCVSLNHRLHVSRVTLAETLNSAGYHTAGFFSGPAMHPVFGVSQGFDEYVDCTSFAERTMRTLAGGKSLDAIRLASHADITNPRVYERVRAWLRRKLQRPFFLFIHMWDVHADYIPPAPYDKMFDPDYDGPITGEDFATDPSINADMPARDLEHLVALYDGEIAWTDHHVGLILDELDALGLRDSTLVTLLSDHGDEHFEHGRKGHHQTLFDEVIRVPLVIRFPGRVPAGNRFAVQVRMIDVLPTILDLAGLSKPDKLMGQSLSPLFSGGQLKDDTIAVSELYSEGNRLRSFRRLGRKLIYDERVRKGWAFDLENDPLEKNPLQGPDDPTLQALVADAQAASKRLANFRTAVGVSSAPAGALPEKVRRQLQRLGYIGTDGEDTETKSP